MSSYGTTLKYDDSPSFCALWKFENVLFIGITLCGCTKLVMSTLELVKNGRIDVLSLMSSIHSMSSILIEFEQQDIKE